MFFPDRFHFNETKKLLLQHIHHHPVNNKEESQLAELLSSYLGVYRECKNNSYIINQGRVKCRYVSQIQARLSIELANGIDSCNVKAAFNFEDNVTIL